MTIETKYNLNDFVYYVVVTEIYDDNDNYCYSNYELKQGYVDYIRCTMAKYLISKPCIQYSFTYELGKLGNDLHILEKYCFDTEEEALLFIKENTN